MRARFYLFVFVILSFVSSAPVLGQTISDSLQHKRKQKDSVYITRLDTLLHLQSWVSANRIRYILEYNKDLKLVLAPSETNNISLGFSYRYLDLGISFSPNFMNKGQEDDKKGTSDQFGFKTGFSIHRFNLSFDLSKITGFYLQNSNEFTRGVFPDSPYHVYPGLSVGYISLLMRYKTNRNFSTAALTGGTQIQRRSAISVLPTLQFASYKFNDDSKAAAVQNQSTYSTDLNLIVPVAGTWVISRRFSASLSAGPSFGVDFFKSVALDDSAKVVLSKGTKLTTGYSVQGAVGYNAGRFFAGIESRSRSYGHKIEDISRLTKQYSYFQVYVGWRLRAPRFAKKSLDWVNKTSPINFD